MDCVWNTSIFNTLLLINILGASWWLWFNISQVSRSEISQFSVLVSTMFFFYETVHCGSQNWKWFDFLTALVAIVAIAKGHSRDAIVTVIYLSKLMRISRNYHFGDIKSLQWYELTRKWNPVHLFAAFVLAYAIYTFGLYIVNVYWCRNSDTFWAIFTFGIWCMGSSVIVAIAPYESSHWISHKFGLFVAMRKLQSYSMWIVLNNEDSIRFGNDVTKNSVWKWHYSLHGEN